MNKIFLKLLKKAAKSITKEQFLNILKEKWGELLTEEDKNKDIEEILDSSIERIKKSGFGELYDIVGVTRDDLRDVLMEILEDKEGG